MESELRKNDDAAHGGDNRVSVSKTGLLWNSIGSTMLALSTVVLSYFTIHVVGAEDGGLMSLALTVAQVFGFIGYFETRNYQNSEGGEGFSFAAFRSLKRMLLACNLLAVAVYTLLTGVTVYHMEILALMGVYRALDGYADLYESELQHRGKLAYTGASQFFRSFLSILLYAVLLLVTRNMLLAAAAACGFAVLSALVLALIAPRLTGDAQTAQGADAADSAGMPASGEDDASAADRTAHKASVRALFFECLPVAAGMILWALILSISRIAVGHLMTDADTARYQVLFLPINFFALLVNYVYRPFLPQMGVWHRDGDEESLRKLMKRSAFFLVLLTAAVAVGGYLLGPWFLGLISGLDLNADRLLFAFLMLAGGLSGIAIMLYYVLIVQRKQKRILICYVLSALVAILCAYLLTAHFGLTGAAVSFFLATLVLLIAFFAALRQGSDAR